MLRRVISLVLVSAAVAVLAQTASADPTNAKNSTVVTANCGAQQLHLSVNGNGEFTPAHVIGSTSVFVPTAFNLTFSFTPTGGTTESETDTSAKQNQAQATVTCNIPAALNTFPSPEGTFTISGTATGFFTPQTTSFVSTKSQSVARLRSGLPTQARQMPLWVVLLYLAVMGSSSS